MRLSSFNPFLLSIFHLCAYALYDCCSLLQAEYPDHVFSPRTLQYVQEAVTSFWSNTSRLAPSCVFTPDSVELVSGAVQLFEANGCAFAVRGGGHCPNKGWASVDNGVLVAMTKLNMMTLHDGYVSVGAGQRWGPVFDFLEPHGLVVVGGRTSPVGVAGLTLGCGLSHFSGKRGLACDNVKRFQVVVSGGQILEVSSASHPDLFWALKGNYNKFGIVTRFDLYTYSVPQLYAGVQRMDMRDFDQLAHAFDKFVRIRSADEEGEDVAMSPKLQYISYLGEPFILLPLISTFIPSLNDSWSGRNNSRLDLPPPLADFANLPYTNVSMDVQTMATFAALTEIPDGLRYELRTLSFGSSFSMLKGFKTIVEEEFGPIFGSVQGFSTVLELQTITKNTIGQGFARGSNSLGIDIDEGPMIWLVMANSWLNADDDGPVQAAAERIVQHGQALARELGLYVPFLFANDAAADQQVVSSYGRRSIEKLNEVRRKYDGNDTFSQLISGGFPIPTLEN